LEAWIDKKDCSYCSACGAVCPRGCIAYTRDEEGFFYPEINNAECNNCGLCKQVCPSLHPLEARQPLSAYAGKHRQSEIRGESSSGGVFYALAACIIERGGAVFGAAMNEHNQCVHVCAESLAGLKPLMGSKYVQSYLDNVFPAVKKFLKQNRMVMFSGTPCQTAGLRKYLGKDYDNLYCVSIICHGAPSPLVFEQYLKSLERRTSGHINGVKFRNKCKNWDLVDSMLIDNNGGQQFIKRDSFLIGFLNNLYLRHSCNNCKANNFRTGADLTIGDYWGGSIKLKNFDDGKGVSALIVNTEKGKRLFNNANEYLDSTPATVGNIGRFNPCLYTSVKPNPNRAEFFKALQTGEDFDSVAKRFIKPSLSNTIKRIFGSKTVYWLFDKVKRGESIG